MKTYRFHAMKFLLANVFVGRSPTESTPMGVEYFARKAK